MSFDISDTLAPNSEQLDAVDLLGGSQVFTIAEVSRGNGEQPVKVRLAEFDRPWMPGKSMRRVLAACWGTDAGKWAGRQVELYCDPEVRFGGAAVGGVRIKSLSNIDKRKGIPLLVSRGKSAVYVVEPLREQKPKPKQASTEPQPDLRTSEQSAKLFACLNDQGMTDRDEVLQYCSTVIGRDVDSTKTLTKAEAAQIIDALEGAQ